MPVAITAMVRPPELLLPRALALCMYELWGWPTDMSESIRTVSPAAVQRALEESCAPEQLRWFALVPSTDGT